ncbi:NAD-dependent epimerase/dehydratase family protein [Longimicrobium sp.]|uniref:NAD-dependent epimerase/dehydratase family protein n=1 Tax=Longimicrobium sp. TaxID=2029185 RepID=UPI002F95CC48
MNDTVLITGGAGFIGSHTADALLREGYAVRVLDTLDPQVHGPARERPAYLDPQVELVVGDVRDPDLVERCARGARFVYHFASLTGVTQSMYDVRNYVDVNVTGTAALWDVIVNRRLDVEKVVLSSSRAVYGEGSGFCRACDREVHPLPRQAAQLERGDWEVKCPACGADVQAAPVREDKPPQPLSIYAETKVAQERISRCMAAAHGVGVAVLRYFNVYGPRQALGNPYTGIAPTFCSRVRAGETVCLYEDGRPLRDFVHVSDVVQANLRALAWNGADGAFNVGSGDPRTIEEIARAICARMGAEPRMEVTGQYRAGDIRGCYADLEASRRDLGYVPAIRLEQGIADLVDWVLLQDGVQGKYEEALQTLESKGLVRRAAAAAPALA